MKVKTRFKSAKLRFLAAVVVSVVLWGSTGVSAVAQTAPRDREESRAVVADIDEPDKTEVTVKGMYIYVTTPRTVTVRLYSILGQLVRQQPVQAGTTRIKAPSRGVYVLQVGTVTRRVTINQ